MSTNMMTYAGSDVVYDALDLFKRKALQSAVATAGNIKRLGLEEVPWSRGESTYLTRIYMRLPDCTELAVTLEELGTKNKVADAMQEATGVSHHNKVAQCNVAMSVNDVATLATPSVFMLHLAAGASAWFSDEVRCDSIIEGTVNACNIARCAWGGGETSVLKGIIIPGTILLAGVATGVVPKKRVTGRIAHGDSIILLESSGIHANGITLARDIAEKLPEGYLTKLPDGRTYGDTLLDPTHIYAGFVEDCLVAGIEIHYAVNITGHGWRKFMRSKDTFTYRIVNMPKRPAVFDFIQQQGPVDIREMYSNYNMGAGFALYVPPHEHVRMYRVWESGKYPFEMILGGFITKSDTKRVVIESENIVFGEDELQVR